MEWQGLVGKLAPMLGTALAGPLGAVALSTVADALGLSDKTEAAVTEALGGGASHEQLLALKNAETEFQLKMLALGFENAKDLEALAVSDRDSARKREEVVRDNTPKHLAYIISASFFSILVAMLFISVPEASRDILNVMLGTLGAGFSGVISYFLGSSAGSKAKTDMILKADAVKE